MRRTSLISRALVLAAATALTCMALACGGSEEAPAPSKPGNAATPTPEPADQTPEPPPAPAAPEAPDPEALVKRGKAVYMANCIACHNHDPALDGGIGPAVAGASLELLDARVIRGEYPEGYTPKRDSNLMIPLPYLEPDLAALAAYLAPSP